MRQSAETENLMTSVERVMEYGDLPSEAELTSSDPEKQFHQGKYSILFLNNFKEFFFNFNSLFRSY